MKTLRKSVYDVDRGEGDLFGGLLINTFKSLNKSLCLFSEFFFF